MRVTLFHMGFPEYVMGLANALAPMAQVTVVHPEWLSETCQALADANVTIRTFSKPRRRSEVGNLWAMRNAFDVIGGSRPDLVHVQETFDYGYDLHSLWHRFPKLVTTIHDVVPHPGDGHAAPGLQYTKAIGIWRSERLIVHTAGMRARLASRFRIDTEHIDVIPHGELGTLYRKLAEKANLPPAARHPLTLLFFGRIWPYKGLRYLLEAFSIVKRELPEARLIIAGRGGDLQANAARIASLKDVEVLDCFIPEHHVAGLFERSSVVVLPYIEASQSGVSAIAFTLGTVVVASRVGGLAEQLLDGETAILAPAKDSQALAHALIGLLRNPAHLKLIRDNAQQFGEACLNWKTIAEETMESYRRAMLPPRNLRSSHAVLTRDS